MGKRLNQAKYLECLNRMMVLEPGHRIATLRNYLAPLEKKFGESFDPLVALDELESALMVLRDEISKKALNR